MIAVGANLHVRRNFKFPLEEIHRDPDFFFAINGLKLLKNLNVLST
jgi:hypothetical protein